MKILEERPVPYPKAKRILEEREKEGELSYEQKSSIGHLRKFSKLEDEGKICEELRALERLREDHVAKIINNLPKTPEEIRVIFQKDVIDLSDEDVARILEITKKYAA